jgi:hypothetical protein
LIALEACWFVLCIAVLSYRNLVWQGLMQDTPGEQQQQQHFLVWHRMPVGSSLHFLKAVPSYRNLVWQGLVQDTPGGQQLT